MLRSRMELGEDACQHPETRTECDSCRGEGKLCSFCARPWVKGHGDNCQLEDCYAVNCLQCYGTGFERYVDRGEED